MSVETRTNLSKRLRGPGRFRDLFLIHHQLHSTEPIRCDLKSTSGCSCAAAGAWGHLPCGNVTVESTGELRHVRPVTA